FLEGGHGAAPPFELMSSRFTSYLYGVENGEASDPRAWIVREGDDRLDPTPYPDCPHPEAAPGTLRVTPGGKGQGGLNGIGGLVVGGGPEMAPEGRAAGAGQRTETLV